ncbi:MAG: hypothetical protein ACI4FO_09100 [Acutalibacteraceae bacterium]
MKTTFKKVFDEFDDELMYTDEFNAGESIDIDVEKIKGEVLMRINDKNGKKKFSKKIIAILIAAAIVIAGTVGAFATGSVQSAFKELFNNNSGMNSAGLYDGGNVELISCDDSLNVELLGVTGDGEKLYSAIEITKKDGSAVIDEDYEDPFCWINERPDPMPEDKTFYDYLACKAVYMDKNGNLSSGNDGNVQALNTIEYSLSEDNKSLKLFVFSLISEGDLKDGRLTVTSEGFGAYNIHEVIYEVDYAGKAFSDFDDKEPFDEELIDKRMQELGITEDDCISIVSGQKIKYSWCDTKKFELPFEISFDLNYESDGNISKELTVEDAPNVIEPITDKAKMEITPFSVYLYGQCDKKAVEESGWSEEEEENNNLCFKDVGWEENSKIILNDGTVYYLYPYEGGKSGVGEDGNADYYEEKLPLNLSTVVGAPILPEINVIDTREIKTVMINGDIVYSK